MNAALEARIEAIDALLPQTQCTRCGYAGCRPYAQAIVQEGAAINRCPPGGEAGLARLAAATGQPIIPLDPSCGESGPRHLVRIDPELCIGCTLCIQACPVDAIAGASKRLHAVIDEWCTGCDLCIPPCPVDCIVPIPAPPAWEEWTQADADAARSRMRRRAARLIRVAEADRERLAQAAVQKLEALKAEPQDAATARKRAIVEAAIARARERTQTHAARRSAQASAPSEKP